MLDHHCLSARTSMEQMNTESTRDKKATRFTRNDKPENDSYCRNPLTCSQLSKENATLTCLFFCIKKVKFYFWVSSALSAIVFLLYWKVLFLNKQKETLDKSGQNGDIENERGRSRKTTGMRDCLSHAYYCSSGQNHWISFQRQCGVDE